MAKAQGILRNFIDKVKLERDLTDALDQDLKNVALETESAIKDNTPTVSGDLKKLYDSSETGLLRVRSCDEYRVCCLCRIWK